MSFWIFLVLLCACGAAAATGSLFSPGAWYRDLNRPSWTPPDWLFPVAWSVLYLCMSAAGARVAGVEGAGLAMAFWALQIALNTLWTPVFFGKQMIRGGLIVLSALWVAVFITMILFFGKDTLAGLLFVPYLAWVSTAFALNFSVWRLNPGA